MRPQALLMVDLVTLVLLVLVVTLRLEQSKAEGLPGKRLAHQFYFVLDEAVSTDDLEIGLTYAASGHGLPLNSKLGSLTEEHCTVIDVGRGIHIEIYEEAGEPAFAPGDSLYVYCRDRGSNAVEAASMTVSYVGPEDTEAAIVRGPGGRQDCVLVESGGIVTKYLQIDLEGIALRGGPDWVGVP